MEKSQKKKRKKMFLKGRFRLRLKNEKKSGFVFFSVRGEGKCEIVDCKRKKGNL